MRNRPPSFTANPFIKFIFSLGLALAVILLLLAFPAWAGLVNTQLNTGTANSITSIGNTPAIISDDGKWVVYIAEETAGKRELFSVPLEGGTPVKLNPTLGANDDIYVPHVVSADSQWVVFNVRGNGTSGPDQVYSVPIDGSSTAKPLHASLSSGQLVSGVDVTPDSSRVIIRGELDTDGAVELYSVPIDGSSTTPTKLHPDYVSGRLTQSDYLISSDSQYIIYRADQDTDNALELYSTRIDGSTSSSPTRLNATAGTTNNWVWSYRLSDDNTRVIYVGDLEEDGTNELYSVEVDGTNHVKLHSDLSGTGKSVSTNNIAISADSSTVVFIANLDTSTDNELYKIPISGGTPAKLNGTLTTDGDVISFEISADSSRVVYRADQNTDGRSELYSTPITTSSSVRLNTALDTDGKNVTDFVISDDSTTVVYRADQETDDLFELYSTPIDNSSPVKLNDTLAGGDGVSQHSTSSTGYLITPDSSRVIYRATQDDASTQELYLTPIGASAPITLNGTLVSGGNVGDDFWLDPDGQVVVYVADQTTDGDNDLYASYITSNVGLNKTVQSASGQAGPGDTLTYTLTFSQSENSLATGVVITDIVPSLLTSLTVISQADVSLTDISSGQNFVWQVDNLSQNSGGTITITGVISPALTDSVLFTNTATITTTAIESDTTNNTASASFETCATSLTVTNANDSGDGSLRQAIADACDGATITFASDYAIYLNSTLSIDKRMIIDGSGHKITVSGDSLGDGDRDVQVFLVTSSGVATLSHLSVVSGTADFGGAVGNAGVLTLDSSTFVDNAANDSGGVISTNGTVVINNSTFSGNTAGTSGGVIINQGVMTVTNSTFSGNSANSNGGGIYNLATLSLQNTIIANSLAGSDCVNAGTINSNTRNLVEDGSCSPTFSGDPLLADLADNGGEAQTHALLPSSPAIDAGDDATCETTDQRGQARVGTCDIGAFESQGFSLTISGGNNQSTLVDTTFANPLEVTVSSGAGEPVGAGGIISFTTPSNGASLATTPFTATTNSSGVASVTVTANSVVGSYVVTATANGVASPVNFNLTNTGYVTLTLTKTVQLVNDPPSPGDPVTYTLVLANSGNDTGTNVTVQDSLPTGVSGSDSDLNQTVTVTAGQSLTFTLAATVTAEAGWGVTITNTASYSHTSGSGSDTVSFTVISDTTAPVFGASPLITPTGNIELTETRPTFDWDEATDSQSGVISYTLLLTSSNDSLSLAESSTTVTTTGSNYTPSSDLATGVYTWTVRAHDVAGNMSDYVSPAVSFKIVTSSSGMPLYLPLVVKN